MDSEITDDIRFLSDTPSRVRELLQLLPESTWRTRPSADAFSAVEQVCHLRDLEEEGYGVRLTRMLSETTPALPDFDGARVAIERAYNEQDLDEALEGFTHARERNVATFSSLDESEFKRKGTLEGVGDITIRDLLSMMREHDDGHLSEFNTLINSEHRSRF
jgi:DinB superfamily